MKLSRSFYYILFILSSLSNLSLAQKAVVERPRLVVGIMIDGLQQNHIDRLSASFQTQGLNTFFEQGVVLKNAGYNIISAGSASDIATVMTGSIPFYHGIAGDKYYDKLNDKIQTVIYDGLEIGIGTDETYSAHNLLATNILDELNLAYPGKSKTYAIAIDPEKAIMLGGHTANSVAWIDDINMKWATTGYYREGLNKAADRMNIDGSFKSFTSRTWKPIYALKTYQAAINGNSNSFDYKPTERKAKKSAETILRTTPSANSLVTELGIKILSEEQLGTDNIPDMLMLQFTVRTPNEKIYSLQTTEKEDMYLRLDKEIQSLLQEIDTKVGLDKTLLFMFSNQTDNYSPTELGKNKIPAGYFSASRSMALVNSYLMALYGQERWIQGYYGKNIYLNRAKIEEKNLKLNELQELVANFMLDFEGVQSASPTQKILNANISGNTETSRMRNSMHKSTVGDVVFNLMPGWLELDEKMNPVGESNSIINYSPVCFLGWKMKPQVIKTAYLMTDIAPTISEILGIQFPNACLGKPIIEALGN
jgi:hypothetical protein